MKNTNFILIFFCSLSYCIGIAQQTLNVTISSNFIFGGGQGSNFATLQLQPIAVLDVEPDPSNTINFNINTNNLEAGLPATGPNGITTHNDIWINFTYRGTFQSTAQIYVKTNQPVPAGITLKLKNLSNSTLGGNFTPNPNGNTLTLSTTEQALINNFTSGYSGNGIGSGYQLQLIIENHSGTSLPAGFEIIYEIK